MTPEAFPSAGSDGEAPAPPSSEPEFLNRELQWLEFNARVLDLATDPRTPLLERVRFLAIFSTNLDEFFMKRVGGLRRQIEAGVELVQFADVGPQELLRLIRERVVPLTKREAKCYRDVIQPALAAEGIELVGYEDLAPKELRKVRKWYQQNVFPLLTPLAVDPGHRFPFISNLSLSLGLMLKRPDGKEPLFARVKIPEVVEQWYEIERKGRRFVPLIDIVEHNCQDLFPGMEIMELMAFRVTRNADIEGDFEDADDLLAQIQLQLRERRFAPVVRMQIAKKASRRLLVFLSESMEIEPRDIYETSGLLDFGALNQIADLQVPHLHFTPWTPVTPPRLRDKERGIFEAIRQEDVLVHHPYESFDSSVERFIEEAAADPNVLGIKQALYRTSGDSPFIHELIHAAEAGKQVAVLVELRARFDEARNIHWARKLEDAGVHVAYGVVGLKTHTKITLVVRREHDGLRCYAHIGTGNYHSKTARLYEDIGLLTSDPAITGDVVNLFNHITGRSELRDYQKLLVAPHGMKKRFLELIEREIELHTPKNPGLIVAKMNQLQDRDVIQALYRASRVGVQIDLIIRGFCTLRPGVPGLSENIRVTSILGRFLEHSRIYYFRGGHEDPLEGDYFIGSADWMYRNLHYRIEAITPIEGRRQRARLHRILTIAVNDHRQCWDMKPNGSYVQRSPDGFAPDAPEAIGTHRVLMALTLEEAGKLQR